MIFRQPPSAIVGVCLALALVSGPALASQDAVGAASEALSETFELSGRPLIDVTINGEGPFSFIVDSGANRTSVSQELVDRLELPVEAVVALNGVTGATDADAVRLAEVRLGDFVVTDLAAPVVQGAALGGADGVVGVDALAGKRVVFNFKSGQVWIRNSRSAQLTSRRLLRLDGAVGENGLTAVAAEIGGVRAQVLLDTGARHTLANAALRRDIAPRRWERWRREVGAVTGVTDHVETGELALVPSITLGGMRIVNVPVAFGDFHVFTLWDLADRPALLLGSDVLRHTEKLIIDYETGDVFVEFDAGGVGVNVSSGAASLLRRDR